MTPKPLFPLFLSKIWLAIGISWSLCNPLQSQTLEQPGPERPGKQVATELVTSDGTKIEFLIYLPQDFAANGDQTYPLLLFLHGRGESQGGIEMVAKWGPPQMAARGDKLPFVIVSPQCPANDFWSSEKQIQNLTELMEQVIQRYKIDTQRVYLTGLSMGGFGSWSLAAKFPEKFAAVVPICGAGDTNQAERLKSLPIWVFHGDQDNVISIKHSQEMVDAIRAAGGDRIRYTTLEHVGHNSWSSAYAMPELYQWLLQHKRTPSAQPEKQ